MPQGNKRKHLAKLKNAKKVSMCLEGHPAGLVALRTNIDAGLSRAAEIQFRELRSVAPSRGAAGGGAEGLQRRASLRC